MKYLMTGVLLWAAFAWTTCAFAEECPSQSETMGTVVGKLEYHPDRLVLDGTAYKLVTAAGSYTFYPLGPYFTGIQGKVGSDYPKDVHALLLPFEDRQVKVTGCSSPPSEWDNGMLESITAIEPAS